LRTGTGRCFDAEAIAPHGPVKEIINRGGEKISPREVDEVLLDHPAVAQASPRDLRQRQARART